MGKLCALLVLLVLSGISSSAFAQDARDCESQASHMKNTARADFLTSCLARLASPENVRQAVLRKKQAVCERNAKNLSLYGEWKGRYIGSCLERNEAARAYASAGSGTKYVLRISLEQFTIHKTSKPAPVVAIAQPPVMTVAHKESNGRKYKQHSRQADTCKHNS